jgi:hypothetical protein
MNSRSALNFFLIPKWIIPVQVIKDDHNRWDQIQVFIHPVPLHYPFRNVPFVRISLLKISDQYMEVLCVL